MKKGADALSRQDGETGADRFTADTAKKTWHYAHEPHTASLTAETGLAGV